MQVALLVALLSAAAFVASAEEVSSVGQSVGQQQPQHQPGQLVPVVHSVSSSGEQVHHVSGGEPHGHVHEVHHHAQDGHPHDHPGHQQFVPAGVIQVVGPQQYSSGVVGASGSASGPVASSEQYGKPESASIPPNYKPFGSWGLYIGGNPADGYYSNYYKALGNSVDKQQVSGVEQAAGPMKAGQVSAFQPMLRQAVGSNVGGASYADQVYPFDYYTPADLNSGSRVAVLDSQSGGPSSYASGVLSSPASIGAQVYGAPMASAYNNQPEMSNYADAYYSTKRVGSSSSSFGVTKGQGERAQQQQQVQQVEVPAKGYAQQPRYAYVQSPAQYQQVHHYAASQGPQVVAYPVPVGSQIVGSQPGTDGAYAPYGVHGYTRYAVKPTVVANSEQQYYHQGVHSAPIGHFPVYKQQQQQQQQHHQQQHQAGVAYQPLSFYGYPLNQLHYSSASQGSIVPAFNQQHGSSSVSSSPSVGVHEHQTGGAAVMMAPAPVGQVEAASSEKSESTQSAAGESKPAKEQQQKS